MVTTTEIENVFVEGVKNISMVKTVPSMRNYQGINGMTEHRMGSPTTLMAKMKLKNTSKIKCLHPRQKRQATFSFHDV